jgi:Anti-sigma factor NepR
MKGPEKMALLQAARAAAAQHRLVASAAQQERTRAAAAQHRLLAAAAQQDARRTRSSRKQHPPRIELSNAYWTRCLKRQYKDALAAPLPARLATLITQLETPDAYADRGSSHARARA